MKNKSMAIKTICITIAVMMIGSTFVYANAGTSVNKDESVYVTLTHEGVVKEKIVSDWVHSNGSSLNINDVSILKNIVNLKGDDVPVVSGDNLKWQINSQEVFYQGTTDKELPLEIKIRYYFNGKEEKPEDIAGKSGKIKIVMNFINNEKHTKVINGEKRILYTPITTVVITDMPLETFSNIKVDAGQVFSDGNNQIVAFAAFPGMKENLKLKKELIDIPENLEITADVRNFKMGPVMITATPKLPDISAFKDAKKINDLVDGIKELKDASSKLTEWSAKLSDNQKLFSVKLGDLKSGSIKLKNAAGELKNGIIKINDGVKNAEEGASKLSDGIKTYGESARKLSDGAIAISDGVNDFADNSKKFADGASQVVDGIAVIADKTGELGSGINLLVDATEKLKTGQGQITEGAADSIGGIQKLKDGKQKELQALDMLISGNDALEKLAQALQNIPVVKELADKLYAGLEQQKKAFLGLKESGNQFVQGLSQLENGIGSMKNGSEKLTIGLNSLQEGQKKAGTGAALIAEGGKKLIPAADQLKDGSEGLKDGAGKLQGGAQNLKKGANEFSEGSEKLQNGAVSLKDGLSQISKGACTLTDGAEKFSNGFESLSNGINLLNDGSIKLSDGADKLKTNMKKFNDEGIIRIDSEISDKIGDVDSLISVKDELVKLSDEYKTFSGIGKNMDGSVKFIMKTDEIKLPELKQAASLNVKVERKGFLAWLKGLFNKK